jgi:hypothetical protein
LRSSNISSNYAPTYFNKALEYLPKYVGNPVHDAGVEGCGVPAASFCVPTTLTIKITITV